MEDMSGQGNGRPPLPENSKSPPLPPPSHVRMECPRCFSFDTKFCYYNNGSSSQPRYLCKTCKRHWTVGGTLRNIPVGGGSRKRLNKGGKPSSSVASSTSCSSSFLLGESSRSQDEVLSSSLLSPLPSPLPSHSPSTTPPLPPDIRGYSSVGFPSANSLDSAAGGNLPLFSGLQNLNHPQGFNQPPLNGTGNSSGGEILTSVSFMQGFTHYSNLNPQQSNYQTLQTEEQMVQTSFWSQLEDTTNVAWADHLLVQPSNDMFLRSGSARPSGNSLPNQRFDDVDEDHRLPGCFQPPPSS